MACTKTARMKSNSLTYLYDSGYRALCIEQELMKSQSFTYLCLLMTQSTAPISLLHKFLSTWRTTGRTPPKRRGFLPSLKSLLGFYLSGLALAIDWFLEDRLVNGQAMSISAFGLACG